MQTPFNNIFIPCDFFTIIEDLFSFHDAIPLSQYILPNSPGVFKLTLLWVPGYILAIMMIGDDVDVTTETLTQQLYMHIK